MLVLSRARGEEVIIGDNIIVSIVDIRADKVRLGIHAPSEIPVHRREVYDAIQRENARAAKAQPCQEQSSTLQNSSQDSTAGEMPQTK